MRKTEEEILREVFKSKGFEHLIDTFSKGYPNAYPATIEAMQTFAQQGKWVKVEDGLPEEGQKVYALQDGRHQYCAEYRDHKFIAMQRIEVGSVTHWTPQLNPPNSTPST